jgi:hypothetical protein
MVNQLSFLADHRVVLCSTQNQRIVHLRRAMPATQNSDMTLSRLFCKIDGGIKHHPKTKEVTHEKTYRKVFRSRQG